MQNLKPLFLCPVGVTEQTMHSTPEIILGTVLVCGPEAVSYEIAGCETAARFHHFATRIFFEKYIKHIKFQTAVYMPKMSRTEVLSTSYNSKCRGASFSKKC